MKLEFKSLDEASIFHLMMFTIFLKINWMNLEWFMR